MIGAGILSLVCFAAVMLLHMHALRLARATSERLSAPWDRHAGLLIVLISHLLVAGVFALGLFVGESGGLGGFEKERTDGWMDYYYFALITVTTVGLGDIYPTGHLRFATGVASLTGFILISCTAQYVFQLMSKQEDA